MAVDKSVVHLARRGAVDELYGTDGIQRYVKVTGESVARATRDDGKGGVGTPEGAPYLVHRAVATDGADDACTVGNSLTGDFLCVASIRSLPYLIGELLLVEPFLNLAENHPLAGNARDGIVYKDYLLFLHGTPR